MDLINLSVWLLVSAVCARTDGQSSNATTQTNQTATTVGQPHEEDNDFQHRLAQSRLFHLWNLQRHVLDTLGWNSTPPSIDPATRERLIQGINPAAFVTLQRNCYYPACDLPTVVLPEHMNRTLWFDSSSRHSRFFFNIPDDDYTGQDITSALVKLHLKRRQDCACAYEDDLTNSRIHIKIYQYRKPIRSAARLRHSNMRLIDAKMVTWDSSRWVTLQVTDAVKRIARGRRNAGFEVQIKNMDEEVLDTTAILDPIVCTPTTEFECNENSDSEEYEDSLLNLSPMLVIKNRINVISQGLSDKR